MRPTEIFSQVKGIMRDVSIDSLPDGFVWDMVDYIPNRKGSHVDMRGAWKYLGPAFTGNIWGGRDCRFSIGDKLLVSAAEEIYEVDRFNGEHTLVGDGPPVMVQNAVKLRDVAYFMDGQGLQVPTAVYPDNGALKAVPLPDSAPKSKVGIVYKDRLILADGADVRFSPLSTAGTPPNTGPLYPWDVTSLIGTSETINGFAAMQGQILVFHTAMIERIRGDEAPAENVEGNMTVDTLSDQVGCTLPGTIVPWRENIIWADERGVYLTDGTSVKSLTEQGGISDLWREVYAYRFEGAAIHTGVYLDFLCISILATAAATPIFLICDLNERTWIRFKNFSASCLIPGEGVSEELFCGLYGDNRMSKASAMFSAELISVNPPPDFRDGNNKLVLPTITTGFKKLDEEGLERIRQIHVSYQHQSYQSPNEVVGLQIDYRLSPPTQIEIVGAEVGNWMMAGKVPNVTSYSRKKVQVGKRGYGIMVRITALSGARVSRLFSIGVKAQAQDRGKVTT